MRRPATGTDFGVSILTNETTAPIFVRSPKRTSGVHCGNGFGAGFSLYQSTSLNRYDAIS